MNVDKLKPWISRLGENSLARNTLWMLLGQGARLLLQAVYFVIIARSLGAEQYGAFVGVTALVAIVAPFASWGGGHILVKNVSRNRALFNEYWGNALFMALSSGLLLIILVQLGAKAVLPGTISPLIVFFVSISDLLFARILDTAGQAFQSVHLLSRTAQVNVLLSVSRLIAALCLISFFQQPGPVVWAGLYLVSTAVSALVAVLLVHRMLGAPKLALSKIVPEITQGFYFSISLSAQTIYNDIDKTMLARFSTLEATGIYAAAYRLIDVAFVPLRSMVLATYPSFFQHGAKGIHGSASFAKRLLPISISYGLVAGAGLFFFAPIVPHILGSEYTNAVEALRWLALLPLLKGIHYLGANTLTGADMQGFRSAGQVFIAVFNVLVNLWIISAYSWKGAAWSSIASDALLMLALWGIVWFKCGQKQV